MKFWQMKVVLLITATLSFQCSDDSSSGGTGSDDLYLASNVPNNFKVNVPDSIKASNTSGGLDVKGYGREDNFDETDSGLSEIKEAVASVKQMLFEENIEIEYLMIDLFYPLIIEFLEENPDMEYVPQDELVVQIPGGFYDRLVASLTDYVSASEARDLLDDYGIIEGDYVSNPNIEIEDISAEDNGYNTEIVYWWDDDADGESGFFETIVAFDDAKSRVRITYVEFGNEEEFGEYEWQFTYAFDSVERTQTLRDTFVNDDEEYSEVFTLHECSDRANDCVEIFLSGTAEVIAEDFSEFFTVFGLADDVGGFIQEEVSYDEAGTRGEEAYREEFDAAGNILNYWYGESDGDDFIWYDSNDEEVEVFDSEYFDEEFDTGFDVGLAQVSVCGGVFQDSSTQEFEFVIVYNAAGGDISSDEDFEELIFGGGYHYYEVDGSVYTETEAHYWEDEGLLGDTGDFQIYKEEYAGDDFTFTLLSGGESIVNSSSCP